MPLYHFAQCRLGPGSIIEPGNFGRLLERYVPGSNGFGNAWLLSRELIFEQLRPDGKPSRLDACFALPTKDDAEKYQRSNDSNFQQVLHEVELVDASAAQHTGGLSFCDMQDGAPFLDPMRISATDYWAGKVGDPKKGNEFVVACPLRVIQVA